MFMMLCERIYFENVLDIHMHVCNMHENTCILHTAVDKIILTIVTLELRTKN